MKLFKNIQKYFVLCALVITMHAVEEKKKSSGLYEMVFMNTTNRSYRARVDFWGDIENETVRNIFKTGGDKFVTIPPMDQATGKPSIASFRTSLLFNKVTFTDDKNKSIIFNIPSKPGINSDLRGKDWEFDLIPEGNATKICPRWAHTKLQDQATLAAEITGIIAGAVAVGAAAGAAVGAVGTSSVAAEAGATIAAGTSVVGSGSSAVTTAMPSVAVAAGEYAGAQIAFVAGESVPTVVIIEEGLAPMLVSEGTIGAAQWATLMEALAAGGVKGAISSAAAIGAGIGTGLSTTGAAVLGGLAAAADDTKSTLSKAGESIKKEFSKAFGLSRKRHDLTCIYIKE